MKIFTQLVIAFTAVLAMASAQADTLGMVLDVRGSVKAELAGQSEALDITAPLKAGMRIQLEKGSEISFVFYPGRAQISATGPATLQMLEQNVKQLRGTPLRSKALPDNRHTAVFSFQNRVVPAAMVMKSGFSASGLPNLLEPKDGETVLDEKPEFSWKNESEEPMDFTLRLDGKVVHQVRAASSSRLILPMALGMQSGRNYEWEVVPVSQSWGTGRRSTFKLASAALRSQVQQSNPGTNAEVADLLLYAMVLGEANMQSESRRVWNRIVELRPASAYLQSVKR